MSMDGINDMLVFITLIIKQKNPDYLHSRDFSF